MRLQGWLCVAMLCAAIPFADPALADDVLVMKNGDRITGTVKKIWDGKLHIEPAYSGEIAVDLDKIKDDKRTARLRVRAMAYRARVFGRNRGRPRQDQDDKRTARLRVRAMERGEIHRPVRRRRAGQTGPGA